MSFEKYCHFQPTHITCLRTVRRTVLILWQRLNCSNLQQSRPQHDHCNFAAFLSLWRIGAPTSLVGPFISIKVTMCSWTKAQRAIHLELLCVVPMYAHICAASAAINYEFSYSRSINSWRVCVCVCVWIFNAHRNQARKTVCKRLP